MSAGGRHLKDEGNRVQVILAGGIAGLVSRFCTAPLDVVKIRLQLQTHSLSDPLSYNKVTGPVYKGTLSTLKAILEQEGLTGLWKGNIPAEFLYVCYGGIQFTSYRVISQVQSNLPHRLPNPIENFISGAGAGAIATASTYPLDLLRTRFAAQGNDRVYNSLISSIRDISRHEGYTGFFRGVTASISQIVPYMGLFFAAYETFRIPMHHMSLPFGSGDAGAGILASILAKTAVFPLDLVRKRLQVQGPTRSKYIHRNIPEYRGIIPTMRAILAQEGTRGLYRGLTVSLVKAAPASAVTMWTYEHALRALKGLSD